MSCALTRGDCAVDVAGEPGSGFRAGEVDSPDGLGDPLRQPQRAWDGDGRVAAAAVDLVLPLHVHDCAGLPGRGAEPSAHGLEDPLLTDAGRKLREFDALGSARE